MNPIEVCLTVDIEFTINGALNNPDQRSPLGSCCVFRLEKGVSQGLAPLLTALERNGLSATFFVEAMQTCHFGNCEMSRVIDYVRKKDCLVDLQLHLHPEWKMLDTSDWRTRVKTVRKNGSMAGRGSEARDMIIDGYDRFTSLTGEIPVALRTGGPNVDLNVLRLQQEIGIPLSSSVGIGIYRPIESELNLLGGLKHFGATTKIPVFSFALNMPGYECPRLLTIIGNSFRTLQAIPLYTTHPRAASRMNWTPTTQSMTRCKPYASGFL